MFRTNLAFTIVVAHGQVDSVADQLNKAITKGDNGVFTGGRGVVVRVPERDTPPWQVSVPATFLTNDLITPRSVYPSNSNVNCPTKDPNEAFWQCTGDGPWNYASMAYVISSHLDKVLPDVDNIQHLDWGWGVFYATDSNSADRRCVHDTTSDVYDCPGGLLKGDGSGFTPDEDDLQHFGAGSRLPGNPFANSSWGGGAGCHFSTHDSELDQILGEGEHLTQDKLCQCNYGFSDDWSMWVDLMASTLGQPGPTWQIDLAACWVNNPRDMIELSNALFKNRLQWNDQLTPAVSDPSVYWGWNEFDIKSDVAADRTLRDAVAIFLPAGVKDVADLGQQYQAALEHDLQDWFSAGDLETGDSLVFVRTVADEDGEYSKEFFCSDWSSKNNKFTISGCLVSEATSLAV